jgi:hypothetical protein
VQRVLHGLGAAGRLHWRAVDDRRPRRLAEQAVVAHPELDVLNCWIVDKVGSREADKACHDTLLEKRVRLRIRR